MTGAAPASHRVRRIVLLACIVAWLGAFAATHTPLPVGTDIQLSDKTMHVVGYFALGSIFWLTLLAYGRGAPVRAGLTGIVMASYGAVDELTQPWFNRFASVHDWLADLCGIVIAIALMQLLLLARRARARRRAARN